MALLDPSLNGVISLFVGKMKHLIRWKTKKFLGQIDEDKVYDGFTWYGGHEKYDLHLDFLRNFLISCYHLLYHLS